jgi:hypothetical protein
LEVLASGDVAIFVVEEARGLAGVVGNSFPFLPPFKPSNWNDAYTIIIISDLSFCTSTNVSHIPQIVGFAQKGWHVLGIHCPPFEHVSPGFFCEIQEQWGSDFCGVPRMQISHMLSSSQ